MPPTPDRDLPVLNQKPGAVRRTRSSGKVLTAVTDQTEVVEYNPRRIAVRVYTDDVAGFIALGLDRAIVAAGIFLTPSCNRYEANDTLDGDLPTARLFVKGSNGVHNLYVMETVLEG